VTPVVARQRLPYRACAGACLFNRLGLVLIGRRRPAGTEAGELEFPWQLPQGGIDEGEEPLAAARRELFEETNVRSASLLAEAPGWLRYDLPDDAIGVALKGKYRGQKQKWYAFVFHGDDAEIDIERPGGGGHKPEFDAWRWERLDRLPGLVVGFKRPVYEQLAALFSDIPAKLADD